MARSGKLSEADIEDIRALYRQGHPLKEIAARFSIATSAAHYWAKRGPSFVARGKGGGLHSKLSRADREEIIRLAAEGRTQEEIAQVFGVTRQAVSLRLKKDRQETLDAEQNKAKTSS